MRFPPARVAMCLLAAMATATCGSPLGRQYEYEEQLYLSVNGAASAIVNASIPALVALRRLPLDPSPSARPDREAVRRVLEAAGCEGVSVGQPWTRRGRRFIQMRLSTDDVRTLGRCALFSWSAYGLEAVEPDQLRFTQTVGAPLAGDPGAVNWDGSEIVGFKLHLPSKVLFQNVKRLADGENGSLERGNILSYEQYLKDRRAGTPVSIEVAMGADSILVRTLSLFGIAVAAALSVVGLLIWLTVRRGKAAAAR